MGLADGDHMDTEIQEISVVRMRRRPDRRSADRSMIVASQDIARRAYELFLDRGGEHGRDLEDWLQAETEIRGRVAQA